jgi:glutamate racemase
MVPVVGVVQPGTTTAIEKTKTNTIDQMLIIFLPIFTSFEII